MMEIRPFLLADEAAVVALWERCGLTRPWNDPRQDILRTLAVRPDLFPQGVASLGHYDAIVSFDTLEHLEHREIALMRITDNLNSDGVPLMNTPCGHPVTNLRPAWSAHNIGISNTARVIYATYCDASSRWSCCRKMARCPTWPSGPMRSTATNRVT